MTWPSYGWNPQLTYQAGLRALMTDLPPAETFPGFGAVVRQTPAADFGALVLYPGAERATADRLYGTGNMGFFTVPDDDDHGVRVYLRPIGPPAHP